MPQIGGAGHASGEQTTGITVTATSRTATVDGAGNAIIADGTTFINISSTDANYIIVLPTPTIGTIIWLIGGSTGYELRTNTPTSVAINGGFGSGAESAISGNTLVRCVCTTANSWVCSQFTTAGVESAVEVAAA